MELVFPVAFLTLLAVLIMCAVLICYFELLKPQIHKPTETHIDNNGAIYDHSNVTQQANDDYQLETLQNVDNSDFITNITECETEFNNTRSGYDTNTIKQNIDVTEYHSGTVKYNTDTTNCNICNVGSNDQNVDTICHNSSSNTGSICCDSGITSCDIGITNCDSGTTSSDTGTICCDSGITSCDTGISNCDSGTISCDCTTTNDD